MAWAVQGGTVTDILLAQVFPPCWGPFGWGPEIADESAWPDSIGCLNCPQSGLVDTGEERLCMSRLNSWPAFVILSMSLFLTRMQFDVDHPIPYSIVQNKGAQSDFGHHLKGEC